MTRIGLDERGQAYYDAITGAYELSRSELELLNEVCRTLDLVDRLEARLDGGTDLKISSEIRQQRLLVSRMIAQLHIPTEQVESLATQRARHAAEKRWESHVRRSEA